MSGTARGRVLITGGSGFTGRYAEQVLSARGYEVHGMVNADETATPTRHPLNLLDSSALRAMALSVRPTHVLHLAAVSFVQHGDVEDIYRSNVVGTRNLLAALAEAGSVEVALLASSANLYGNAVQDPITEETPASPANDYAVSKLAMEYMAALWNEQLPITIVRPFNYTGVGQSARFLVPKIVNAYRHRSAELELGNIDIERDFSDVRDVVAAYCGLLDRPQPGATFNVCSGRAISIADLLSSLREMTGHDPIIRTNPAFVRTQDVKRLRGSPDKLAAALGDWSVRPFDETLRWMALDASSTA